MSGTAADNSAIGANEPLRQALDQAVDAAERTAILRRRLRERSGALDLPNANLAQVELPKARLRRARLSGCDLRQADLQGAFLAQCDLSDARLDGAKLQGCDFSHAKCVGAHFGEADLRQALFEEADLQACDLRFADLSGSALEAARLPRADLWGARLEGAELVGADLSGATLREVKAAGADLAGADLRSATLTEADLQGARLIGADLREAVLAGARLDGACLSGALLQGLDLARCSLAGAHWDGARLDRTRIRLAQVAPAVGEELARDWGGAAGAYFALERNFAELGAVEAASWAYDRRRRMQKRRAGAQARQAFSDGRLAAGLRAAATYVGDTLVEWTCGYGESVARVFASLLFSFAIFMLLYAVTGAVVRTDPPSRPVTRDLADLAIFSLGAMSNTLGSNARLAVNGTLSVLLTSTQTLLSIFLTGLLGFVAGNRIRR